MKLTGEDIVELENRYGADHPITNAVRTAYKWQLHDENKAANCKLCHTPHFVEKLNEESDWSRIVFRSHPNDDEFKSQMSIELREVITGRGRTVEEAAASLKCALSGRMSFALERINSTTRRRYDLLTRSISLGQGVN